MTSYNTEQSWLRSQIASASKSLEGVPKGFFVSAVVAVCAQFLSEHHGAPAMLMALLLGIAFHFLAEEGPCKALQLIPVPVADFFSEVSRWALLIAIAAVGMKTSLSTISTIGGQAIVLIVAETVFIAAFIVIGIHYLR